MRSKLCDVTLIESDISCSMMSFIQNLKNKTYQTKPNNPNLPNQTEETITKIEFTKPNLAKLNIELLIEMKHESKVLNPWVLCAFGNVFSINYLLLGFYLGFFHPHFSNIIFHFIFYHH